MTTFAAVDLGASSGRVVNVLVDRERITLDPVRRFSTPTLALSGGGAAWDFGGLLAEVHRGLHDAAARTSLASVAIDSWAIDYGLLDASGALVGPVHAYRSSRTNGVMERVWEAVGRDRVYAISGIQFLPFNTIYQLVAERETDGYRTADRLLMLPDLINASLCGSTSNDITNASTTQLLDVTRREWSDELVEALGLRGEILPTLHQPGAHLGAVRGIDPVVDGLPVIAAASHDTASAVAGTPLRGDRDAIYISCGTWALVGCEVSTPVTTNAALDANVTNELGVDNTVRLLKNVTGLWLLEECRRRWSEAGIHTDPAELVAAAELAPPGRSVIDVDDDRLATSGDMPARIAHACRESGQRVPESPAQFTRTILESLALKWRHTVSTIERVAGIHADVIHLVGGGSAIPLLSELCASACERRVVLGPQEATVVGNALVQAVSMGVLGSVDEGRRLVERTFGSTQREPTRTLDWDALARRLEGAQDR